jgi:Raf kinase inhibitor-like YbhB/YbcL family protein
MHIQSFLAPYVFLILVVIVVGCAAPDSPTAPVPVPSVSISAPVTPSGSAGYLTLHVGPLTPGSPLPATSTCTGANESPAVSWDRIPAGTKSLVLILDDPDAPAGTFTHWIVYNIPPVAGGLSTGQPDGNVLDTGAHVGDNSAGSRGYYPPCPPVGSIHRYVFRLYAVDTDITLPTVNRSFLDDALSGHTLAETDFVTLFKR